MKTRYICKDKNTTTDRPYRENGWKDHTRKIQRREYKKRKTMEEMAGRCQNRFEGEACQELESRAKNIK